MRLPPNPMPLLEEAQRRMEAGTLTAEQATHALDIRYAASPAMMMGALEADFTVPAHARLIDQHLVALHRGHFDRLMIVAPPRHGKSFMSSQAAPVWRLRNDPTRQQAIATHGDILSNEFGQWGRNTIKSNPILGMRLSRDTAAKATWSLAGKGAKGLWAVGVGGSITGRGYMDGHADDVVKNHEEAQSALVKENQWMWWASTWLTRRTRVKGRVTLSACWTRWAEDDVGGRLLSEERDRWCVLHLKAVAETDETLSSITDADADMLRRWEDDEVWWERPAGGALWPGVYDLDYLGDFMANRYVWSALFQGEPTPTAGGLFRREDFRYWRRTQAPEGELWELRAGDVVRHVRRRDCRFFACADLAASTRTAADFSVITVWAVTPQGDLLLVDMYRGRIGEDRHWGEAQKLHARWGFSFMSVEKGFIGTRLVYDAGRAGMTVREYDPRTADKITRAMPAVDRYGSGRVWHPDPAVAPWVAAYVEPEMLGFGGGAAHDDIVDTIAQAVYHVPRPEGRPAGGAAMPGGFHHDDRSSEARIARKMHALRHQRRRRGIRPV